MKAFQISHLSLIQEAAYANGLLKGLLNAPASASKSVLIYRGTQGFKSMAAMAKRTNFVKGAFLFGVIGAPLYCTKSAECARLDAATTPAAAGFAINRLPILPGGGDAGDGGDPMDAMIDKAWAVAGDLGFGGCLGAASGYALKYVGKEAAVAVGLAFAAAQALAYYGFIEIKWRNIKSKAEAAIDQNADGKFDVADIKIIWRKLLHVLSYNIPSGGSFATGFALGFYYG